MVVKTRNKVLLNAWTCGKGTSLFNVIVHSIKWVMDSHDSYHGITWQGATHETPMLELELCLLPIHMICASSAPLDAVTILPFHSIRVCKVNYNAICNSVPRPKLSRDALRTRRFDSSGIRFKAQNPSLRSQSSSSIFPMPRTLWRRDDKASSQFHL